MITRIIIIALLILIAVQLNAIGHLVKDVDLRIGLDAARR
jgi:hypothetical protein